MPDGIFAKTEAEVALDLVKSYLEFAEAKEREKYKKADAYFELFQRAYEIVRQTPQGAGKKTGF
jgi:hypothetical protein